MMIMIINIYIFFPLASGLETTTPKTIQHSTPINATSTTTSTTTSTAPTFTKPENGTDDTTSNDEKAMAHPSNKGLLKRMLYVVGIDYGHHSLFRGIYFIRFLVN